ncbi:MAG: hypothetical protein JWM86_2968 [Thermoleophilia bacterium]|nr:hypothetical protein [Thermoleophilia bacterium]
MHRPAERPILFVATRDGERRTTTPQSREANVTGDQEDPQGQGDGAEQASTSQAEQAPSKAGASARFTSEALEGEDPTREGADYS